MPVSEYELCDDEKGCASCAKGFDVVQRMTDARLKVCPECGSAVRKVFSVPGVGHSEAGFDDRAKAGGFHKLKRLGKGEYEKQY